MVTLLGLVIPPIWSCRDHLIASRNVGDHDIHWLTPTNCGCRPEKRTWAEMPPTSTVGGVSVLQRAHAVRTYLISQSLSSDIIIAKGFGKENPVASNDNAAGRQKNRRVEMVVSGDIIGQPIVRSSR